MATITFDTLKFVKKLESFGVEARQAEAIAEAFRDAQVETDPLTKKDLQIEISPIRIEIASIRSDLSIVKWMMGFIFAAEVMPWVVKLFA